MFLPFDIVFEFNPVDLEERVPLFDHIPLARAHEVDRSGDPAGYFDFLFGFDVALHQNLLDELHRFRLHDDDPDGRSGVCLPFRAAAADRQEHRGQNQNQMELAHLFPPHATDSPIPGCCGGDIYAISLRQCAEKSSRRPKFPPESPSFFFLPFCCVSREPCYISMK